jgi:hypothetical protein
MQRVDPWQAHERDSATKRNQAVAAIHELQRATGGGVMNAGEAVRSRVILEQWLGIVDDRGPAGEQDVQGSLHWVTRAYIPEALTRDKIKPQAIIATEDVTVVATHLADLSGMHVLRPGQPVIVTAFFDTRDASPSRHYVIQSVVQSSRFGIIQCAGPRGEAIDQPFTDRQRHWWKEGVVVTDSFTGALAPLIVAAGDWPAFDDPLEPPANPLLRRGLPYATHLMAQCGTYPRLRPGTVVRVHEYVDAGDPGTIRYWIESAPDASCLPECGSSSSSSVSSSSSTSSSSSCGSGIIYSQWSIRYRCSNGQWSPPAFDSNYCKSPGTVTEGWQFTQLLNGYCYYRGFFSTGICCDLSQLTPSGLPPSATPNPPGAPTGCNCGSSSSSVSSSVACDTGNTYWAKFRATKNCASGATTGPVGTGWACTDDPGEFGAWSTTSGEGAGTCAKEIWVNTGICCSDATSPPAYPSSPSMPDFSDCCDPEPSSSSSSKSTAIVPVSFHDSGYAALFIAEEPEVRFNDVQVATIKQGDMLIPIDPRYVEVCAPGTLEVCGYTSDMPAVMGAIVEGGAIRVRFDTQRKRRKLRVVFKLTGIRKGFTGQRFPSRTRNQFEHNERFINSAYPSE